MTMIIMQFNTPEKILSRVEPLGKVIQYSKLAYPDIPDVDDLPQLTTVYKHPELSIWFFNATECIDNGGVNKVAIAVDVENYNEGFEIEGVTYPAKFTIEKYDDLYDLGYWPIN